MDELNLRTSPAGRQRLADWMVRYKIEPHAITTHRHVDLGNARSDPRSFDWQQLQTRLTALGLVC